MGRLGKEIWAFASDRRFSFAERLETLEMAVAALGERLKEHFPPGEAEPPSEEEAEAAEKEAGDLASLLEPPLPEDLAPWVEKLRRWAEETALSFPPGFKPREMGDAQADPLAGVSLSDLLAALEEVWERARTRERLALPLRKLDFKEALRALMRLLKLKDRVSFRELFPPEADRSTVVNTFVALLELLRRGRVRVWEDGGEITVSRRP